MLCRWSCWLILALALAAPAQELLRNGDFRALGSEGLARNWTAVTWGTGNDATFEQVPSESGDSTRQWIMARRVAPFRWSGVAQKLAVLPSGLYRFRARVQSDAPIVAGVEVRLDNDHLALFGRRREQVQPGRWTELSGLARLETEQREVYFLILLHHPGTLVVSSASLEPVRASDLSPEEQKHLQRQFGPPLPPVNEAAVLEDLEARIVRYRTAPLTITVLDGAGRPVSNQVVLVEHRRHLFRFGSVFDGALLPHRRETEVDLRHREAFLRLFNTATMGIYWVDYERQQGRARAADFGRAFDWLDRHHIATRAHPVFWNAETSLPAWLKQITPPPLAMEKQCDMRLAGLGESVLRRCTDADVFNELVNWELFTNAFSGLMADQGRTALVTEYLRECKRLSPGCRTVINDYDFSPEYFGLLSELLEAGAPIDLIGQQAHMHTGLWPVARTWTALERLSLLQRPVLFTEVSVLSGAPRPLRGLKAQGNWNTDATNELRQAEFLEQFTRLLYSHPSCAGLVLWNYADRNAWLGAPVGVLRRDGSPKPSFARLDELINRRWRTRGEFTTDAAGRVQLHYAYEGRYRIEWGRQTLERDHSAKEPLTATLVQ